MPVAEHQTGPSIITVPRYTCWDAARYLRAPVWFVLAAFSRPPRQPLEFFDRYGDLPNGHDGFADNLGGEEKAERISFQSLANLFVSAAVFRPYFDVFMPWFPVIERAYFDASAHRIVDDPRFTSDPEWVLRRYDPLVGHMKRRGPKAVPEQDLLKHIAVYQSRVESKDGVPVQLFPFSRDPAPDAPRLVVMDPDVRFGRPTVKGAPTDVLVERWRAGDSAADLADDYGLTAAEVEEALRYESVPLPSPFGW